MANRVFIGVGHGGSDPGAVGLVVEKTANLTMAMEVKRILERSGVTVGISRERDEDDSLTDEIWAANAFRPDLAVEIHNNSGGGDGFEAYVQTNAYAGKSRAAAEAIEERVVASGQNSRGIKTRRNSAGTADYFGWLRQVKAPAVLLEGFFVDGPEAKDYDTAAEQKKLAKAYAMGIGDYLGIKIKEDKIMYKTFDNVPKWGQEAVRAALNKGILKGEGLDKDGNVILNLSEDMTRMIVILHRCGIF